MIPSADLWPLDDAVHLPGSLLPPQDPSVPLTTTAAFWGCCSVAGVGKKSQLHLVLQGNESEERWL